MPLGPRFESKTDTKPARGKNTLGQSPISENENTQSDLDSRNATKERERGKERERHKEGERRRERTWSPSKKQGSNHR